jgi:hypothetical protein
MCRHIVPFSALPVYSFIPGQQPLDFFHGMPPRTTPTFAAKYTVSLLIGGRLHGDQSQFLDFPLFSRHKLRSRFDMGQHGITDKSTFDYYFHGIPFSALSPERSPDGG